MAASCWGVSQSCYLAARQCQLAVAWLFYHIVQTESYRTQPLLQHSWGNMLKDYDKILYSYADVPNSLSHNVTFLINPLKFSPSRLVLCITWQAIHVLRNSEERSRNHCCSGKTVTYYYIFRERERVCVALVIQREKRVCHIILPFAACVAVPCFSTFSHKRYDFRENFAEHKMCFDFLYNFRLKHLSF